MKADRKRLDEAARIRALHRYDVLDTEKEKPFEKIVGLVQQILNVPICAVSLVDTERQWFKAQRGLSVCETTRDISFCTHAIRDYQPFLVRDAKSDQRFSDNPLVVGPPNIGSYAGVPLTTPEGYNVGTLCAIDTEPREFPENEVEILKNFASLVVDELELRMTASTDALTGAMTRRAWTELAEDETKRSRAQQQDLTVALLDIDHFKAVNDTYGHPTGDRVIQAVTDICADALRPGQRIGRIGGEEFAILLPECGLVPSLRIAETCRSRIENMVIADERGTPLSVTCSFGVAGLNGDVDSLATLMQRADYALYTAKANGRNRVEQFRSGSWSKYEDQSSTFASA
ncbi:sensor domain-containing diguanylate cyclase [Hwanghaeella sp.]|uniref:sensor domain-containing diguanylate cyclase n=1 Tax=Hwanghaeella sp. TaxID=2605943 RepID=UPI003CCC1126